MTWREKLKLDIITYILAHPGIDMKQVAAETGYSTKTLRNWISAATGIKRPVGRPKKPNEVYDCLHCGIGNKCTEPGYRELHVRESNGK